MSLTWNLAASVNSAFHLQGRNGYPFFKLRKASIASLTAETPSIV
jgi:hypothetical protein